MVEGHQDFEHALPGGARASFFWRPYPANLSALLQDWPPAGSGGSGSGSNSSSGAEARPPDLVLLGASLWHLLHVADAGDYSAQLRGTAAAGEAFLLRQKQLQGGGGGDAGAGGGGDAGTAQPLILLASTTEVYPNLLPSEEKRRAMTPGGVDAHNRAIAEVLAAGGPLQLLDLFGLTHGERALGAGRCAERWALAAGAYCSDACPEKGERGHKLCRERTGVPEGKAAAAEVDRPSLRGGAGAGCGEECSLDGVHSLDSLYDAAVQLLLGMLRYHRSQ